MNQRTGAIVLLAVASLALVVALTTRGWFRDSADAFNVRTSYGIGLWGNSYQESCGEAIKAKFDSQCKSATATLSWDEVSGAKNKTWLLLGRMTLIVGLLAVLMLIAAAGLLVKRHAFARQLWLPNVVAIGVTMFCAGMYLALQPTKAGHLGYSVFVFFPGAVAGILGALMTNDALAAPEARQLPGIGTS